MKGTKENEKAGTSLTVDEFLKLSVEEQLKHLEEEAKIFIKIFEGFHKDEWEKDDVSGKERLVKKPAIFVTLFKKGKPTTIFFPTGIRIEGRTMDIRIDDE
jgi:hypothetical protein